MALTSLMPTSSPVCKLVPRKISPKDPPPSLRPNLYFPAIRMSSEHIAVVAAEGGLQGPWTAKATGPCNYRVRELLHGFLGPLQLFARVSNCPEKLGDDENQGNKLGLHGEEGLKNVVLR